MCISEIDFDNGFDPELEEEFTSSFNCGKECYYGESYIPDTTQVFKLDTLCFSEDEWNIFTTEHAMLLHVMYLNKKVRYIRWQWYREHIDSDEFIEKVSKALFAQLNGADWESIFQILGLPEYNQKNLMRCQRILLVGKKNNTSKKEKDHVPKESDAVKVLKKQLLNNKGSEITRLIRCLTIRGTLYDLDD